MDNLTKIIAKSFIILSVATVANVAMAESSNEGKTIIKVRAQFAFAQHKQAYNPSLGTTNVVSTSKNLLKTAIGAEISGSYFITDNIASEISLGINGYKLGKALTTHGAGVFTDNGVSKKNAAKRAYFIPLTATVQYHISPDEQFSPYVGAGYHYAFVQGSSGVARLSNSHGPVLQAGFDLFRVTKYQYIFIFNPKPLNIFLFTFFSGIYYSPLIYN
jgi:outer membrane protein